MRNKATYLLLLLLGVVAFGVLAPASGDQDRLRELTSQIRCPVCQGESVADSPSQTARDISSLVADQIDQGWSDDEVFDFYVDRYGEWVLLDPGGASAVLLVTAPVVLLVVAAAALTFRHRRGSGSGNDTDGADGMQGSDEETAPAVDSGPISGVGAAPSRRAIGLTLAAVAVAIAGFLVVGASGARPAGGTITGNIETAAPPRDLSTVTNEEMEAVIAQNPDVAGMRLSLIERYLTDGELERAHEHSAYVLASNASPTDYQQALKFSGWTTALLGNPQLGSEQLEASLVLSPDDLDAQWFLANVRLVGLDDTPGAVALLEGLLSLPIEETRRQIILERLEQAEQP